MMGLRRKGRPALPIAPGERLLAWAAVTADGTGSSTGSSTGDDTADAVGGTRLAFYLPQRLPWEQVASATWDDDTATLRVTELVTWGDRPPVHERVLSEAGLLLQLVRERVSASIVLQREVSVQGRRAVRLIGRRSPAGPAGAAIQWFVDYDQGLDPDDPAVAARVAEELARARDDVGD